MNDIKEKIKNIGVKTKKISSILSKMLGNISCSDIDSIYDLLIDIINDLKNECITRENKWRGRNNIGQKNKSNTSAIGSVDDVKKYYDFIKRNANFILDYCLPLKTEEAINDWCDSELNSFSEKYDLINSVDRPNYEVIDWNSNFGSYGFNVPNTRDFSKIEKKLSDLNKFISSMKSESKTGRITKKNSFINRILSLLKEILDELNMLVNEYEKFYRIFDENNENIRRYNSEYLSYIESLENKARVYKAAVDNIKESKIYILLKQVQKIYDLKDGCFTIIVRLKDNKYTESSIIEEFERRLSNLRSIDDLNRRFKEICKSYNGNWKELVNLLGEEFSPVYDEYSQLQNDLIVYENILQDIERKNKEYEGVNKKIKEFEETIALESTDKSLNDTESVGLTANQSYLLNYITEKLRTVLEELKFCTNQIYDFLNHHQTSKQNEEKIFQLYIEYEKIRGRFLGELAVFIEFISLSRFPKGSNQRNNDDALFNSNDLTNNNNAERKFLKNMLPELFKDLEIIKIDDKGYLHPLYPNDAGLRFSYELISAFRNGINELYKKDQVYFNDSRLGNEFEDYYSWLFNLVEENSIGHFKMLRNAAFYRLYTTFERCNRNYVTFPVFDEFNERVYDREHSFSYLDGPSWERTFMDEGNYQYFSKAYKLPPNISYSEINTYILNIYRMLYELQFKFVIPLCTDELIYKFKQESSTQGHKK